METKRGVPNILAGGFAGIGLVALALAVAVFAGVVDTGFPAGIYVIVAMVNVALAVILWRLT
ncbi:hypothetical protein [Haloferax profundi]|uniref:Uncharacterized protein n=1 Tax=Haloferax profundi TaxID=1544718 RepID=A0A0W1RK10_9EURY|nr:hypothetical protein [Haloferax profundi]KTG13536.1 hypothetical protein AUR66_03350 [Haloferax profundi]